MARMIARRAGLLAEDVTREWVESHVGARIDMGYVSPGHSQILIFMKGGQVQRAVWTFPRNLQNDGRYSAWAMLRAVPGQAMLQVEEGP